MDFHNFFTVRKSDSCSVKIIAVVQSLKDDENLFVIFFFNADAVVLYGKQPFISTNIVIPSIY